MSSQEHRLSSERTKLSPFTHYHSSLERFYGVEQEGLAPIDVAARRGWGRQGTAEHGTGTARGGHFMFRLSAFSSARLLLDQRRNATPRPAPPHHTGSKIAILLPNLKSPSTSRCAVHANRRASAPQQQREAPKVLLRAKRRKIRQKFSKLFQISRSGKCVVHFPRANRWRLQRY